MNAHRRTSDYPHPAYRPGLVLVLAANVLLWTLVAVALHGCVA